jgi:hypothetical protein
MQNNLYANIGKKIQNLAMWCFVIEALGACVTGIVLIIEESFLVGFLTILLGPILAWVSTWVLYGFGQMVDDLAATRYEMNWLHIISRDLSSLNTQQKNDSAEKKSAPISKAEMEKLVSALDIPEQECTDKSDCKVDAPNQEADGYWICGKCKTKNLDTRNDCWSCGNKK